MKYEDAVEAIDTVLSLYYTGVEMVVERYVAMFICPRKKKYK
jgi:hypothetical protein